MHEELSRYLNKRNLFPTKLTVLGNSHHSALQPVCTVHPRVHQNMRGVHHYERVHMGASQTSHLTDTFYKNFLLAKMNQ